MDMDHRKLLDTFSEEIQGKVVRSAVGAACTVVRKQAKKNINAVGKSKKERRTGPNGKSFYTLKKQNRVGRSQKTGTWDGVSKSQKTKRLANRSAAMRKGKDKQGMPLAEFGPKIGATGKSGLADWMMTRYSRPNNGATTLGVTGPAWRVAAQAHILEFGGRHVNWGGSNNQGPTNLPPRPFLRPAASMTRSQQQSKIIKVMKRWQSKR